jgi:hypothetical protein
MVSAYSEPLRISPIVGFFSRTGISISGYQYSPQGTLRAGCANFRTALKQRVRTKNTLQVKRVGMPHGSFLRNEPVS